MAGEPIRLAARTPREELQGVIVETLEDLLARAKKGELESLLVMFETSDFEGMNWKSCGTLHRSQTIGRIDILKHILLNELLLERT
jgi:hypothetical protein